MNKLDLYNTRLYFEQTISPFLKERGIGFKEFAKEIGIDPKRLQHIKFGNTLMKPYEKKAIRKFMFPNEEISTPSVVNTEEIIDTNEVDPILPPSPPSEAEDKFMDIPSSYLGTLIEKFMRENNFNQTETAQLIGIPMSSLHNIRKGKHNPGHVTRDKITFFLQKEGMLSRHGLPTFENSPASKVDPTPEPDISQCPLTEEEIMKQMGIVPPKKDTEPVKETSSPGLYKWEDALLITAIVSLSVHEDIKKKMLHKYFSNIFQ